MGINLLTEEAVEIDGSLFIESYCIVQQGRVVLGVLCRDVSENILADEL